MVPPLATVLADGMTVVVNPVPTGVGVWVMEGASSGPDARIAAELAEASASVDSIGTSPVVSVRVVVAGKVHDVLTDARTTGELLSAMGITPDAHDRVQPSPSTPLHVGARVVFDRIRILTRDLRRSIPFATRTTWTTDLASGQVDVVSSGVAGVAMVVAGATVAIVVAAFTVVFVALLDFLVVLVAAPAVPSPDATRPAMASVANKPVRVFLTCIDSP